MLEGVPSPPQHCLFLTDIHWQKKVSWRLAQPEECAPSLPALHKGEGAGSEMSVFLFCFFCEKSIFCNNSIRISFNN